MKIAVFDYSVTTSNAIGGCHRHLIAALCEEHEFVVFAAEFDNPHPERIVHVPVMSPLRPLALLFVTFHILARRAWRRYSRADSRPPDLLQGVESNFLGSDIVYAQFCHRAYLKGAGRFSADTLALRPFLRWLDHQLRALMEPVVYRDARDIVVPSHGLADELVREYPRLAGRITVIANPIDTESLRMPADFDRSGLRRGLGFGANDVVLVFTALGHFERKGLPIVMEAMAAIRQSNLKLLVVGGEPALVRSYTARAVQQGIANRVVFVGRQKQVRRFLWLADAFVFPSAYETFSLSTYEAAAAALPIVVTRLHGVDDFTRDGENAFVVDRTPAAVGRALEDLLALSAEGRYRMGQAAQQAVAGFTVARFTTAWRGFYRRIAGNEVTAVDAA